MTEHAPMSDERYLELLAEADKYARLREPLVEIHRLRAELAAETSEKGRLCESLNRVIDEHDIEMLDTYEGAFERAISEATARAEAAEQQKHDEMAEVIKLQLELNDARRERDEARAVGSDLLCDALQGCQGYLMPDRVDADDLTDEEVIRAIEPTCPDYAKLLRRAVSALLPDSPAQGGDA